MQARSTRHGVLLLSIVLIALVGAPAATADQPIREVGTQQDRLIPDQCSFPVLGHIEGSEIVTTFIDKALNPIKQIIVFPGNTLTLTNTETGKSITLPSTGGSLGKLEPDGSGFFQSSGHGPSFPNPVTGEPGIWYQSGRLLLHFDANMNVTSVEFTGKLVNLCVQLAS
jgi:hypothetical protein